MSKNEEFIYSEHGEGALKEFIDARNRCLVILKAVYENKLRKNASDGDIALNSHDKLWNVIAYVIFGTIIFTWINGGSAQIQIMIVLATILVLMKTYYWVVYFSEVNARKTMYAIYLSNELIMLKELRHYGISLDLNKKWLDELYKAYLADEGFRHYLPPDEVKDHIRWLESSIIEYHICRSSRKLVARA